MDKKLRRGNSGAFTEGPIQAAVGDTILYQFTVTNPGDTAMSVQLGDPKCDAGSLTGPTGDTDGDGDLDLSETWTYLCSHVVVPADGDPLHNVVTVTGTASTGAQDTDTDEEDVDVVTAEPRSGEICRTPGFWGTHAGDEKEDNSHNIAQSVLDAYNGANSEDPLTICGREILNTDLESVHSALEAIGVSPKGNPLLTLARQLTAAALNCVLSRSTGNPATECPPDPGLEGDVCEGTGVETVFDACNAACASGSFEARGVDLDGNPSTEGVDVDCIEAMDCFNNGFVIDEWGTCAGLSSGCHDEGLESGCFHFEPPGAAGSPKACNAARKNSTTIFSSTP